MKTIDTRYNKQIVMTMAERQALEESVAFYMEAGQPEHIARQYALDELHINRQVKREGLDKYLERKYGK